MSLHLFATTHVHHDVDESVHGLDLLVVELTPDVIRSLREQAYDLHVVSQSQPKIISIEYLDDDLRFFDWSASDLLPEDVIEEMNNSGWAIYRDKSDELRKAFDDCNAEANWDCGSRIWVTYLSAPQRDSTSLSDRQVEVVWSATPKHVSVDVRSMGFPWELLKDALEEEHV